MSDLHIEDFNIPKRHLEQIRHLNTEGKWYETSTGISKKVGSGFLVALLGPRGVGKTQIGTNVLVRGYHNQIRGMYLKAMDFFLRIKETYNREEASHTERSLIVELAKPQVLVLDEIGQRAETPWEDRLLTYLIDLRYDEMKDTILISNQSQADFDASVGSSVVSRLTETGGIIPCNWVTFRK